MIVPNYVPQQLEVPGNVAEQPYPARIAYIRRVVALYVGSIGLGAVFSRITFFSLGFLSSLAILVGILLALELWRIVTRGRPIEATVSALSLVILLPVVGITVASIRAEGWPVWQALVAPMCVAVYTMLCGRDFSFMGGYLLSLIGSSVMIASIGLGLQLADSALWFALGTNLALLTFFVYDLASLLSRRRIGEELAAVTDLYRDVFNFFGYFVRIVRHWKRHRIWTVPEFDVPWNR